MFYVDGFEVSPFESEFGRHVAVFYPLAQFDGAQAAPCRAGRGAGRAAPDHAVRALFLPRAGQRLRLRSD